MKINLSAIFIATTLILSICFFLYPNYWFEFIFRGRFFDLNYYIEGIQMLQWGVILIIGILIIALLYVIKKLDDNSRFKQRLNNLDLFGKDIKILILVLSILFGSMIWLSTYAKYRGMYYMDEVYLDELKLLMRSIESKEKMEAYLLTGPIDFMYIDEERIKGLHNQILPVLILKKKSVERNVKSDRKVGTDNKLISIESGDEISRKDLEEYEMNKFGPATQCIDLINHFYKEKKMQYFESLELSNEEIKKLDELKNIAKANEISLDTGKFNEVYIRNLSKTFTEQKQSISKLKGQIVIGGEFLLKNSNNQIEFSHHYIQITEQDRITFTTLPISIESENIKYESLKSNFLDNKPISANMFCRILTIETNGNITKIIIEPYAIW